MRKHFNHAVQLVPALCLVGVLFLGPVKNTLAYVTSSPVKVVNTFEGETEAEETTEPEKTTEPVETTEVKETTEPVETTEPEKTTEPVETTELEETAEPVVTTETEVTSVTEETTGAEETTEPEKTAEPEESEATTGSDGSTSLQTDDNSHIRLYTFAAVISLAAIIILLQSMGRESKGKYEQ